MSETWKNGFLLENSLTARKITQFFEKCVTLRKMVHVRHNGSQLKIMCHSSKKMGLTLNSPIFKKL